ncbi:MAG: OmpA family protein [Acidiferrobacterales bacterium]|nr:OmpA family protein [Acidiferrobacterales bacterium]
MKRNLAFTAIAVFSLALLAGCAKDADSVGSTSDAPGSSDGVSEDVVGGISDSDEAVGFNIDESSEADGDQAVDPLSQRTVYFNYDESIVSEEAQIIIQAHAEVLLENSDANLTIFGHADERGTREYNLALGDQRAAAVSSFFQEYGVDALRISVFSFGEERPAAMGADESAWRLNRRVEFDY